MSNRYYDWFRQSEADLHDARHSLEQGDFEWSCGEEFERLRDFSPGWYAAINSGTDIAL